MILTYFPLCAALIMLVNVDESKNIAIIRFKYQILLWRCLIRVHYEGRLIGQQSGLMFVLHWDMHYHDWIKSFDLPWSASWTEYFYYKVLKGIQMCLLKRHSFSRSFWHVVFAFMLVKPLFRTYLPFHVQYEVTLWCCIDSYVNTYASC